MFTTEIDSGEGESLKSLLLKLFDPDYYLSQFKTTVAPDTDPFYHFIALGWWLDLDPHPLFSVSYYLSQKPVIREKGICPLVDFIVNSRQDNPVDPHLLFDTSYYLEQLALKQIVDVENPLIHYLDVGYELVSPHPLFDQEYYQDQIKAGVENTNAVLLKENATTDTQLSEGGYRYLLSNAPTGAVRVNPLMHYVTEGWMQEYDPHPLFCGRYYLSTRGGDEQQRNPLTIYLSDDSTVYHSPHPLFDPQYIQSQVSEPITGDPLRHYLSEGFSTASPHVLFENEYYLQQAQNHGYYDIQIPPVVHYIRFGHKENLNPHILFDNPYYAMNYLRDYQGHSNPLSHFIEFGSALDHNPHPFFDYLFYRTKYAELIDGHINALQHYIENVMTQPDLATSWEIDFEKCSQRFTSVDHSEEYIPSYLLRNFYNDPLESDYMDGNVYSPVDTIWKRVFGARDAKTGISRGVAPFRVIFTGNSTVRTSESLSLLRIAEVMKRKYEIDCFFFFEQGGELTNEFALLGDVIIASKLKETHSIGNLSSLLLSINRVERTFALCSSLHAGYLGRLCASLGVPTFGFIAADNSVLQEVSDADAIVYRTIFALGAESENLNIKEPMLLFHTPECVVHPELFLSSSINAHRKLLGEGTSRNSIILLSGGSRSTIQDFSNFLTALSLLNELQPDLDIVPFWIQPLLDSASQLAYQQLIDVADRSSVINRLQVVQQSSSEALLCAEAADVYLHCSNHNPISQEALCAMAAGAALVGYESSDSMENLLTSAGSDPTRRYDLHGLVQDVLNVLQTPALRKHRGERARQYVRKTHAPLVATDCILSAVSEKLMKIKIGGFENVTLRKIKSRRKPTKVFITSSLWSISGVNAGAEQMVNGLNERGWRAELLFLRNGSMYRGFEPSCPHRTLRFHGVRSHREYWETCQSFLLEHAPCIVLSSNDRGFLSLAPALPDDVGLIGKYENDLSPCYASFMDIGRYCHRSIGTSEYITSNLIELQPQLQSKVQYIRSGGLSREEIERYGKVNRGKKTLKIIYAGRLSLEQKRVYDLIEIVEQLELCGLDYRLKIVGEDDCNGALVHTFQREWQELIACGKISIVSRLPRSELLQKFSDSDVCLLISEFEGLPLVLMEAMGCGCVPVVTEIKSGVPELVTHGKTGIVVKDRDWEQLAHQLTGLFESPVAREELAAHALNHVTNDFLIDSMVEAHHQIISEVAGEISAGVQRPKYYRYFSDFKDVIPPHDLFSSQSRRIVEPDEWKRGTIMELDYLSRRQ